jgi:hypothetical protein
MPPSDFDYDFDDIDDLIAEDEAMQAGAFEESPENVQTSTAAADDVEEYDYEEEGEEEDSAEGSDANSVAEDVASPVPSMGGVADDASMPSAPTSGHASDESGADGVDVLRSDLLYTDNDSGWATAEQKATACFGRQRVLITCATPQEARAAAKLCDALGVAYHYYSGSTDDDEKAEHFKNTTHPEYLALLEREAAAEEEERYQEWLNVMRRFRTDPTYFDDVLNRDDPMGAGFDANQDYDVYGIHPFYDYGFETERGRGRVLWDLLRPRLKQEVKTIKAINILWFWREAAARTAMHPSRINFEQERRISLRL